MVGGVAKVASIAAQSPSVIAMSGAAKRIASVLVSKSVKRGFNVPKYALKISVHSSNLFLSPWWW